MRQDEAEYITATEAMLLLDVSKGKMAKLIKTGVIPYTADPRNERAKLIKRSDIDTWLAKTVRSKVPHKKRAIAEGSNTNPILSAQRDTLPQQRDRIITSPPNPPGPDDDMIDIEGA